MSYIYETHLHTSEGSRCASASAEQQIRRLHRYGYDGVCVTDHFLNGNTTVPSGLSWEERIHWFCRGYEAALAAGASLGMKVFFGWEYSYYGTDFLTYGLGKDWLLRHPEILSLSTTEYCDFVRSEGGAVIHAHPFREAEYIEMIRLVPRNVDGVEVLNACRTDFENRMAAEYAKNYGLIGTGGSDMHHPQSRLCGVSSETAIESSEAFAAAILSGRLLPVTVYDARPDGICD